MRSYRIYVPAPGPLSRSTIWPGSGIVGEAVSPTQLEIYYEGNLYGAINMRTWADRVYQAAARRRERAPTVARMIVRRDDYVAVGTIDMQSRSVRLRLWSANGWRSTRSTPPSFRRATEGHGRDARDVSCLVRQGRDRGKLVGRSSTRAARHGAIPGREAGPGGRGATPFAASAGAA